MEGWVGHHHHHQHYYYLIVGRPYVLLVFFLLDLEFLTSRSGCPSNAYLSLFAYINIPDPSLIQPWSDMLIRLRLCTGVPARVVAEHGIELRAAATETARDNVAQAACRSPGDVLGSGDRTCHVVGGTRDSQPRRWRFWWNCCIGCSGGRQRSNMSYKTYGSRSQRTVHSGCLCQIR